MDYSMETNTSYHIRIKGHLDERWMRWFEGLEVTQHPNGETLISGVVMDQAALHGILNRICDLGLELISVQRYETGNENESIGQHERNDHDSRNL
jgi:hypothetical protein